MEYTRRYLMDGLHNLRDLGGYAVPGGITRFGVLLRSDLPWHLTEDDGKRFAALEVRHTLDLRDVDESESMPDELALLRGVAYRQIAMKKVPRAVARNRPGGLSAFDEAFFWGDEYIRMLEDNHPWAKECAEFLAAAEGTVLFHCFTGKDGTHPRRVRSVNGGYRRRLQCQPALSPADVPLDAREYPGFRRARGKRAVFLHGGGEHPRRVRSSRKRVRRRGALSA